MNRSLKQSRGLTLIELMISVVIGLMLLAGITGMLMTNKRIYKEQESMSRLQENARFAIDLLLKDIRMAGYTGCSDDIRNVQNHIDGSSSATDLLNFSNAVEGAEQGVTNWLPSNSTSQIGLMMAGTDGISIRYLRNTDLQVIAPYMNTNSAALHVANDNGLNQGQVIGVSDCDSAEIFSISNANPDTTGTVDHNTGINNQGPDNATKDFQKKYLDDAAIVQFVSRRYIIGTGASGQPALFRYQYAQDVDDTDGDGITDEFIEVGEELIEGVEDMQVLYGEDTTGNQIADTYLTAANVSNWPNVVSVRISLLFNNLDENFQIDKDVKTHKLLGGAAAGGSDRGPYNDTRRRRIFTTTVQIRNRSA